MHILKGNLTEVNKSDYSAKISLGNIGNCEARATRFENEPKPGDEVIVVIDEYFSLGFYIPLKVLDKDEFTGIARSGYKLEFTEDGSIIIKSKDDSTSITIEGSNITIKGNNLKIEGSNTTITGSNIKVNGNTTITGGTLNVNGTAGPPGVTGPFCAIPICPFTGLPHVSNLVTGT